MAMRRYGMIGTLFGLSCAVFFLLHSFRPTCACAAEDRSVTITIGAVGDIMVMQAMTARAYDADLGEYDYSEVFSPMKEKLRGPDLMCGNLETTIAGENAGYSEGVVKGIDLQRFNAPEALAASLKDAGFDVLTLANNHIMDKGYFGLCHTLDVLDGYGLAHTGAWRTPEERAEPLIVDVKGLRIGIVAATLFVNRENEETDAAPLAYRGRLVARISTMDDGYVQDVRRCRDAGADFIIAFVHWGAEGKTAIEPSQRETADRLLAAGADIVIGSHPHVVQRAEYRTVERDGGEYTGLVLYSLGNFAANTPTKPECYGIAAFLTVRGIPGSGAGLVKTEIMGTVIVPHDDEDKPGRLIEVLPCFLNPDLVRSRYPISKKTKNLIRMADKNICPVLFSGGTEQTEELCWIS